MSIALALVSQKKGDLFALRCNTTQHGLRSVIIMMFVTGILYHLKSEILSKTRKIKVRSFPRAAVKDFSHFIKPLLKNNPTYVILHCGTNNLRSDTPEQIEEKLKKIETEIKNICPSTKVIISSLTCRFDSEKNHEAVGNVNYYLLTVIYY